MLDNFDEVPEKVKTATSGPDDASNTELVRAATEENVRRTINDIAAESTVIDRRKAAAVASTTA
jgi:hypothetical protein